MGTMRRFTYYRAEPCLCKLNPEFRQGRSNKLPCGAWHVSGVAAQQGVRFSQGQAKLVAFVLNVARLVRIGESDDAFQ